MGEGTFGIVWLEREERGALRAVKQISKSEVLMNSRELLALSTLKAVSELPPPVEKWFWCSWIAVSRSLCAAVRMV